MLIVWCLYNLLFEFYFIFKNFVFYFIFKNFVFYFIFKNFVFYFIFKIFVDLLSSVLQPYIPI